LHGILKNFDLFKKNKNKAIFTAVLIPGKKTGKMTCFTITGVPVTTLIFL